MSYRALYRKYRPRLFADIIGQPGIVQALSGQVESGRISHAYLFSGPRGTGKTSAAKVLARAINCERPVHGEACGACKPCVELLGEANMDVIEIDAASNNSVDKVREMLENVKYMPAVGRFRVYIVDEVHMLSVSAFNALLKTLEEPPAHVVFILATTEPHKLPATVLSRCQQFQFKRIPADAMERLLEGVLKEEHATAEPEAIAAIARASDGGMRDALSLMDQCLSLSGSHVTHRQVLDMLGSADSGFYFDVAECLLSGDAGGAAGLLDRFINEGGDVKTFAVDLCRHMRDLFISSYVKDAAAILDVSQEQAGRMGEQAHRHAPGDMLKCLGILSELEGSLRYAASPRIHAELALFRCCRTEKAADYGALLARVERLEAGLQHGAPPMRSQNTANEIPAPVKTVPAADGVPSAVKPATSAAPAALPEVPWFEEEDEPDSPPPAAPRSMLLDEDSGEEKPPENLPGQMDLFGGAMGEQPAGAPERSPAPPALQPGRLWSAALRELEKQPQLMGFAKKGKATAFDGHVLTVTFTEDGKAAAGMLSDERRMAKVKAAVEGVAGGPVQVVLKVDRWSPSQQQVIERSRAVIPEDAEFVIEEED